MQRTPRLVAILALVLAGPLQAEEPGAIPNLHEMLMGKFDAMNARKEGIFRQDITSSVAAYFPVGQPIAETRRIIAQQKLGTLKPFKGTNDPGMGTMYVAKFDLMSQMFSHVYVVLDFDYDGAGSDMTLKAMKAYLRASNM